MWERRALATAEELDFPAGPFSAAFVTVYLAWIRMITGNLDEAREFGQRTLEIADAAASTTSGCSAPSTCWCPSPTAVRRGGARAVRRRRWTSSATGRSAPRYLGIVARNHHYLGDADAALEALDEALERPGPPVSSCTNPTCSACGPRSWPRPIPTGWTRSVTDLVAAVDIGLAQGSLVLALAGGQRPRPASRRSDRPADWADRIRAVLDRFPPNSTSPEFAEALDLLGA